MSGLSHDSAYSMGRGAFKSRVWDERASFFADGTQFRFGDSGTSLLSHSRLSLSLHDFSEFDSQIFDVICLHC